MRSTIQLGDLWLALLDEDFGGGGRDFRLGLAHRLAEEDQPHLAGLESVCSVATETATAESEPSWPIAKSSPDDLR